MLIHHIEWAGELPGVLRLIDQRLLPGKEIWLERERIEDVFEDIRTLAVRGAPAIGVAAAFGVVVGVQHFPAADPESLRNEVRRQAEYLRRSRPTAVNLFWALDRMERCAARDLDVEGLKKALLAEARSVLEEDLETCRKIGQYGAPLVPEGGGVITHCNAGGLATSGYGTALGVLFAAREAGKRFTVYADETRPLLQGARLTTWELGKAGIDHVLVCEGAAATLLRAGKIGMAVVGADRIAGNGDTANKVGTYPLAVLAHTHGVPFYVAAPASTFDLSLPGGDAIPIEERAAEEVVTFAGVRSAPEGTRAFNPAFDVTPAGLIAGISTEFGIIEHPDSEKVR
ncbi:MAG: S-methyl-5-thioribose-1-phosphate isomerase, partial [Planctomycetota bacterium]